MDVDASGDESREVELAAAGDMAAFERLYRRHAARVHSLARRLLGAREADDATQEVFLRAWRKLSTYRADGPFGAWLSRLAVRLLLARVRASAPERAGRAGGDVGLAEVPATAESPERSLVLEAAVAALPEGARQVLVLHDIEGYGHAEIARQCGVSIGTSKSQLHRARMLLRASMERGVRETAAKEKSHE